ncbi:MAG TPA: serine hydrolase domain-containing protein [Flavobacteriales bacterium]|nr:serine hydrolase domain-containing protein [Flavobacteriales bacterium]
MKKNHIIHHAIALFFLSLLTSCAAQPAAQPNKYEAYLSEASARGQFNGAALVYDKGKVVYQGAFGIRSIDPIDSLDVNSQFRLASVSKQFTAMAIMILKEQGKLSYDQDVRDFIPELPYAGITIRHLLHHVSGVPDYEPLMDQYWKPELKYDDPARYTDGNAEVIRMLAEKKPPVLFKPGERWEYSNTGYNLLGTIVARASGVSFAEYTQKHIFDPAGMSQTVMYDFVIGPDPKMPHRAFGFQTEWNGTDRIPADSHYLNPGQGEDGVYSTVGDLLKWDRILYTDKLVSKATLEEAFTPGVLNDGTATDYGFGWFIQKSPTGKRMVTHSGGWLSFGTYIVREIEEDKCIVILQNSSTALWGVVAGLTDLLYDKPAALPPLSIRRAMGKLVASEGVESAIARYKKWKVETPAGYTFNETELNVLGYELVWAGRAEDGAAILKLNLDEYPTSANVYDSYGDALLAKGDTANALLNFKKAFAMDATMTATKEKIDAVGRSMR